MKIGGNYYYAPLFPFLKIGITLVCFHLTWKVLLDIARLKRRITGSKNKSEQPLRMYGATVAGPRDFLGFSLLKADRTSLGVRKEGGRHGTPGRAGEQSAHTY